MVWLLQDFDWDSVFADCWVGMGTEDGSRRQRSEVRRYPVENMLELMAAGMKIEELLTDYPDLEREDLSGICHQTRSTKKHP